MLLRNSNAHSLASHGKENRCRCKTGRDGRKKPRTRLHAWPRQQQIVLGHVDIVIIFGGKKWLKPRHQAVAGW